MADDGSILITGAAGQLGAVGRSVTGLLLDRGLRVRAMVRREDERAAVLRAAGALVVVGDLLEPADVYRVVSGCRRVYFGMSVSPGYLEATAIMAAVAREVGVDVLVNMSQMTVSQMSIENTTPSPQQRQHWLPASRYSRGRVCRSSRSGRPSSWKASSSLSPVRASATEAASNCRSGMARPLRSRRRMSLGSLLPSLPTLGCTWAESYELTGPRSQDMDGVAKEYSEALNCEIAYVDISPEDWEGELKRVGLPEYVTRHLVTMAELNRAGRYDRMADGVERVTGGPAISVREFVALHADEFGGRRH